MLLVFGDSPENDLVPTEMLVPGEYDAWQPIGENILRDYAFAITIDNEVFMHGKRYKINNRYITGFPKLIVIYIFGTKGGESQLIHGHLVNKNQTYF